MTSLTDLRQRFDHALLDFEEAYEAMKKAYTALLDTYDDILRMNVPGLDKYNTHPQMVKAYPEPFEQLDRVYTATYEFMCRTPTINELLDGADGMTRVEVLSEGKGRAAKSEI
jgi:hypothetical protein